MREARLLDVLQGYAAASAELIGRFEQVSSAELLAPVADLLPSARSRIVDVGAGTGRDAAWLAEQGHDVVAVEPVDEFRRAGKALHKSPGIEWLDDRLPGLCVLRGRKSVFDRVLLCAVWQHLDDAGRSAAIRSLAEVTAPGGILILSLRHGRGASNRPVHQAQPEETIVAALRAGFELIRKRRAKSMQAANRSAGVHWTWLAFLRSP